MECSINLKWFLMGFVLGSLFAMFYYHIVRLGYYDLRLIGAYSTNLNYLSNTQHDHTNESFVASIVSDEIKLLCWVMTTPQNYLTKCKPMKETWLKRCDKYIFMSTTNDSTLPAVGLPGVKEGRQHLYEKTKASLTYLYEHYFKDYDYFLKADDDTYVVVENLKYFLLAHKTVDPVYFGARYKMLLKNGYMSGGAGYVLTQESLKRAVTLGFSNKSVCDDNLKEYEDAWLGKCLDKVGVYHSDTRDANGHYRFHPRQHNHHVLANPVDGGDAQYNYYVMQPGINCCSDFAISFHYIGANVMLLLEYMIYHLRPIGIIRYLRVLRINSTTIIGDEHMINQIQTQSVKDMAPTYHLRTGLHNNKTL